MMIESTTMGGRARAGTFGLRTVLRVDAATCLAMGVLLVAAAAPLGAMLALPEPLLFWAGLLLFPCAALMAGAAAMQPPAPWLVWAVILGNAAWVLASIGVLMLLAPNGLGITFVLAQAAVVAALAVLEHRAMATAAARR